MNIYQNKFKIKAIFIAVAILIGVVSLYYTNLLVTKLGKREEKLIDLYAKGLQQVANPENDGENLDFLFHEIIEANKSVPVILVNSKGQPIDHRNISRVDRADNEPEKQKILKEEVRIMKEEHEPIKVEFGPEMYNYIYYKNSHLLTQLKYYPFIQLLVLFLFSFLAYLAFSYSRNAEQNRVWVGMAKETAHQLGTPLSSLMAWLELLKANDKYKDDPAVSELEKDVQRLDIITARFSNIGSVPDLKGENVYEIISGIVAYLQDRLSKRVSFDIQVYTHDEPVVKINRPLFEWVIENLCKNAIDAMDGVGSVSIGIIDYDKGRIAVDITDTGKGIAKNQLKHVFDPGFTTKQRGWGLGLTLVKRIVENYHNGKIFVKSSLIGKGTTFRIVLNKG